MGSRTETITETKFDAYDSHSLPTSDLQKQSSPPKIEKSLPKKGIDLYADAHPYVDNKDGIEEVPNWVSRFQEAFLGGCSNNSQTIIRVVLVSLFIFYTAYFTAAMIYSAKDATALIVITALTTFAIVYVKIRDRFGDALNEKCFEPVGDFLSRYWGTLQWWVYPSLVIALIVYLSCFVVKEARQLQSMSGFIFFIVFIFLTSKHPTRVRWRPVIWGYSLQMALAILVLRWEPGYLAVKWIADWITTFIYFALDGAAVVFGDPFLLFHPFAFVGMPMLIYTGAVMAILYYCGITQVCAMKMAWLMKVSMDTTAIETLSVAANIFLHGMDTMMMLRPYLHKLTRSEFNCFLVGSHATIAGFIFGLFVLFGAPPQHLLSAAVMSAPATIAICKLNWPETEISVTKNMEDVKLARGNEVNVFEAAANGAEVAGKTVFTVLINYIAFLGMLAFLNATLFWIGDKVGFVDLSFEWLCSYIMWPIALIIGTELQDCREVAKLIGIKVFASEVLAFQEIGRSKANNALSPRSEALATYALSGFSSISTLAVAVGVWNAVCPQRTREMASMMLRLLTEANISCFTTACIAGLFYTDDMLKFDEQQVTPLDRIIAWFFDVLPSYKTFMTVAEF